MKYYKITVSIMLGVLGVVLSAFNNILGIPTGFGMTVDLAGVPVLIAAFVLGARYGIYALNVLFLGILFTSPTGFIGGIMKFIATAPLIFVPYFMNKGLLRGLLLTLAILIALFSLPALAFTFNQFLGAFLFLLAVVLISYSMGEERISNSLLAFALAVGVRCVVTVITNIYFAGPLFFKMSPDELIAFVESIGLPFAKASVYAIISFWNIVQSIVEWTIAYYISFYRLKPQVLKT